MFRNFCFVLFAGAVLCAAPLHAQQARAGQIAAPKQDAHALVAAAIQAVQGTASLGALHAIRTDGLQHEFMLGNAERADGPWRVFYSHFSELRDLDGPRLRRAEQQVGKMGAPGPDRVTVLTDTVVAMRAGARETGLNRSTYEDVIDRIDAAPERVLLLAAASHGLAWERVVNRYGMAFDVVSFPWRNGRMRVELNRAAHLPDAVEIVRPYPYNFRWAPFGDVAMRTEYVDWTVQPSGLWYPMQQKVSLNGEPLRDITLSNVAFEAVPAPADSFTVGDTARTQYVAGSKMAFPTFRLGMRGPAKELLPGIVRVPDFWTMTLVKQDDGVVIFEAHISAQYLHDVIAESNKRYPGARIKAIVMTSDPWAHIGGVREAIALGIPIYVSPGSIPFLTALAKAPHTIEPDSLQRVPRAPRFMPVTGKTVIGTGANRIELYPVGGPYGERMLMAYFPEHRLLYGADLVFPNRGPDGKPTAGFDATPAADLRKAVAREGLVVEKLFCVQSYGPFEYASF